MESALGQNYVTRGELTIFDIICESILLEQPLNLLLNTFDCSSVHPPPEAPLSNLVERWSDAMWPNEVVDIDTFMIIDYFLTGDALLNKKHLSGLEA